MQDERIDMNNNYLNAIMGLVVGDACGVPVEFMSRLELKNNPVTDMREYGTHNQPRGTWSDDSSMALATLVSLQNGYDLNDIAKQFLRWEQNKVYTPYGEIFDIGITCRRAIRNYMINENPRTCGLSGERDNGNGSLMRILPICIYADELVKSGQISEQKAIEMIHDTSAITHAHKRSMIACGLYYFCVKAIIDYSGQRCLLDCLQAGMNEGFTYYENVGDETELGHFSRLQNLHIFSECSEDTIRSSGYVVHSLEAAIYSMIQTNSFKECILYAVNLGDDTDTVAAIAGGLAGLFYGIGAIPAEWKDCIAQREWIEELAEAQNNRTSNKKIQN